MKKCFKTEDGKIFEDEARAASYEKYVSGAIYIDRDEGPYKDDAYLLSQLGSVWCLVSLTNGRPHQQPKDHPDDLFTGRKFDTVDRGQITPHIALALFGEEKKS